MAFKKRAAPSESADVTQTSAFPPPKRAKLLDDDDESDASLDESGGVALNAGGDFKINEEFAKRFEHNEKRKERERLEEKYGNDDGSDTEDSTSEEEDDDGELATEGLDAEIFATLQAIRSKDPRVYDKDAKFYSEVTNADRSGSDVPAQKPMYLKDYHRKNYMQGNIGTEEEDGPTPFMSVAQKERELQESVIREVHAAAEDGGDNDASGEEDGFLTRKAGSLPLQDERVPIPNVEDADKDPDTFLSNFMSSRAWVPNATSRWQPFESDDEEEDARAEAFEDAYNMRFEDPEHANEKLMTHSREAAAKYSVRREELSGRKKIRERERQRKEEEKKQRNQEKQRLRKLKIEEVENKVRQIKKSAGIHGKQIDLQEWTGILDEDWDDEKWEQEMSKRFGKDYYAEDDDSEGVEAVSDKRRRNARAPKWDDDIDIKDIVPDFEDEDDNNKAQFTLSGDDDDSVAEFEADGIAMENSAQGKAGKKDRTREVAERKRSAKRDRRIIESIVDQNLDVDMALANGAQPAAGNSSNGGGGGQARSLFRYRETSPVSFGLTATDILNASDAQLNDFVGLKKLTAFRDPDRKRKDKKRLGKKARLREWRKDVFRDGADAGGAGEIEGRNGAAGGGATDTPEVERTVTKSKKKRRRSKKGKTEVEAEVEIGPDV